jgi:DNA-binding NarL/FixJ family response regulator
VYLGEEYISPELLPVLISGQRITQKPNSLLRHLTEREMIVLQALGQGKSVATVADELFVSKHTVESHRKNIYAKLNLHSAIELMRFVRENNLS